VTPDSDGASLGSWITVGLLGSGAYGPAVPTGFEAYAEIVHEAEATKSPEALQRASLHALLSVLHGYTSTPDRCFFGQWTVWGYLPRPTRIWTFDRDGAHAHEPEPHAEFADLRVLDEVLELTPDYRYQVLAGPLKAAELVGHWRDEHTFDPHAPDLIWPQDRA
jgi:hypothetical protein